MITLNDFAKQKKVFLVAHRGSSEKHFENTIDAYLDAVDSNVKMIEVDLQVTKDNQVIACHNSEINCLVDNSPKPIDNYNYNEINQVLAENSKTIEKNCESNIYIYKPETPFDAKKFNVITLPLLADVIKNIYDKAYLILEIKSNFTEKDIDKAEVILNEVKSCNYLEQTLFASFDVNILTKLKELYPECHLAVIKNPYKEVTPSDYLKLLSYDAFICSVVEINDRISDDAHKNNIFLGIYSTDTLEQLELVKKYKANAIVTNYPSKTLELIKENNLFDLEDLLL